MTMKRLFFLLALIPFVIQAQTRNVVPRATSQGKIGTEIKSWLAVHADSGLFLYFKINGVSLASEAFTDSTYRAAQSLLRILYSDTTSTVANQWRLAARIPYSDTTSGIAKQWWVKNITVEISDSSTMPGYATRTNLSADTTYRAAQMALKKAISDTTAATGYYTNEKARVDTVNRNVLIGLKKGNSDTTAATGYYTNEKARVDTVNRNALIAGKIGVVGYSVGDTTSFSGVLTRLAVNIVGARQSQIWYAQPRITPDWATLPVAGDFTIATAKWDSVIFKRAAGTTSGLKLQYFRVK